MKKLIYPSLILLTFIGITDFAVAQNVENISIGKPENKIIDNGFYKYEITGDAKTDAENASKAKQEFVAKYPEQYEKMKAATFQNAKQAIDYKVYLTMPVERKKHIDANQDKYYFINK